MPNVVSSAPIIVKSVQATLDDYMNGLEGFQAIAIAHLYPTEEESIEKPSSQDLLLDERGVICLAKPSCPSCGKRLARWGTNPRKLYLDRGFVPRLNGVQRYRCQAHGWITIDLSHFVAPRCNYAHEYRRRATRVLFNGHVPPDTRRCFDDIVDVAPSISSIRRWTSEAADECSRTVHGTWIPTSGYYGLDEIYVRVHGEWKYVQTMVDLNTRFSPGCKCVEELSDELTAAFLGRVEARSNTTIKGLVVDGGPWYEKALRMLGLNDVVVQTCMTHYLKNLNEKIYSAAGLGHSISEELPPEFKHIKHLIFRALKMETRMDTEVALALAELHAERLQNFKLKFLMAKIYKDLDKITCHKEHTLLHSTNNRDEQFNNYLEQYPSLKSRMRTMKGVERVVDARTFLLNYRAFPGYIRQVEDRIARFKPFATSDPADAELRGYVLLGHHELWMARKSQAQYENVYDKYFAKGSRS